MDWITGQKFMSFADFIFAPKERDGDDYYNLQNTLKVDSLNSLNIVYTHIMYSKKLCEFIRKVDNLFIVITHSCDCSIIAGGISRPNGGGKEQYSDKFELPRNVVKWYSKNVDVVHPKISSIPIGLENDRWFKDVQKKEKMLARMGKPSPLQNLLYVNHNTVTNPIERTKPYEIFQDKPWVTLKHGVNGKGFDEYLEDMCSHKFILCPQGNGMDTHRTWEALYMGTIPIEKRNRNNHFYRDIPICFVDDWEEVTEPFLESEYKRIKGAQWNMRKLEFAYWKEKINEVFTSHSILQR